MQKKNTNVVLDWNVKVKIGFLLRVKVWKIYRFKCDELLLNDYEVCTISENLKFFCVHNFLLLQ